MLCVRRSTVAIAGSLAIAVAGCAGCAAPARPSAKGLAATRAPADTPGLALAKPSFFADADSAPNATPATPSLSPTPVTRWDGTYVVTLHTKWFGPVHAHMDAQAQRNGFKANTPPNVAWSLVGGVEGSVGQVLMPFLFPRGMIFTWNSTLPRINTDGTITPGAGSIGVGTLDRLRVKTRIAAPGAPAEILFKEDRVMGTLTVHAARDAAPRTTNYPRVVEAIRDRMPDALYDASLARDPKMHTFLDDLANGAARARDDLEFMFAGAAAARKSIEFQMPLIFPEGPSPDAIQNLTMKALADNAYKAGPDNELPQVAVVRFDAFLSTSQVDEAMILALNSHAVPRRGIILDLRTSTGVDVAAFRAAQWLISEPIDAGAYVGATMRDNGVALPRIELRTPSDYDLLVQTLERGGGADITIWPLSDGREFLGPVVVVTSDRTSSTSEALVAVLKRTSRVRLVGQTTAGRPLLSREVPLVDGWILRVAGYDLLAPVGADPGFKDNRGVKDASPSRDEGHSLGPLRAWQRSIVPDVKSSTDGVDEARREMRSLMNRRD